MNQTEAPIIVFQSFTPAHLEKAVELSKDVSWPHRLEDWALTLSVSSGIVAMEGNEIVGDRLVLQFRRRGDNQHDHRRRPDAGAGSRPQVDG